MRHTLLLATLILTSCGVSSVRLSGSEDEEIASAQSLLQVRLEEKFGPGARIQRVFNDGLVGVSTEPNVPESDVIAPVGLATWDPATSKLEVLDATQRFREAALASTGTATLDEAGILSLSGKPLAEGVRGDLVAVPASRTLLYTREPVDEDSEASTAIAVVEPGSAPRVLVDTDGSDDRPSLSPDGKTVVFVSGRTGIASLFRTTLGGAAPVQLTNVGLENLARAEDDESEPAGFVPVPVTHDRISWTDASHLRFDAGGGEYWVIDVRDGSAKKEVTP